MKTPSRRALVVGAGMAGLACARVLVNRGLDVTILDKGRGPGGRASTRRASFPERGAERSLRFDHGAQYFTVRNRRMEIPLRSWLRDGVVAPWEGRFGRLRRGGITPEISPPMRYVGVPGMSALIRRLIADLDVEFGCRVETMDRFQGAWVPRTEDGRNFGGFEFLVLAIPAPQAVPLLSGAPELARRVAAVGMAPTWSVLAAFPEPVPLALDGAFVDDSPLSWVARDSSKPGRPDGESWVLHASAVWSREHVQAAPEDVIRALCAAFGEAVGAPIPESVYRTAHRWLYARTVQPVGQDCLFDPTMGLAVCGDACRESRLESAFLSGVAAGRVLVR